MESPEQKARAVIDESLQQAGWVVQDAAQTNLGAGRGIAIREFPLKSGFGFADYLLYVDYQAVGIIEAKKDRQVTKLEKTPRTLKPVRNKASEDIEF